MHCNCETSTDALILVEAIGGQDADKHTSVLKKRIEKANECF